MAVAAGTIKRKPSLHQIIAVVAGKKTRAERLLTETHQKAWNEKTLAGITRTYAPLAEDGEKLPPQGNNVQVRVHEVLATILPEIIDYMNVIATQETGNTKARADIVVGEQTLLSDVPIGVILFLEKRLEDLTTFISNLPVLPSDKEWRFDQARNCFVTEPVQSERMQKVPQVLIKHEPTKEHPAQTEVYHVDKVVGYWTAVHFSGAITAKEKAEYLTRCRTLAEAVKKAREAANSVEVDQVEIGKPLIDFIFGKG